MQLTAGPKRTKNNRVHVRDPQREPVPLSQVGVLVGDHRIELSIRQRLTQSRGNEHSRAFEGDGARKQLIGVEQDQLIITMLGAAVARGLKVGNRGLLDLH